jgi:hypothetical protein
LCRWRNRGIALVRVGFLAPRPSRRLRKASSPSAALNTRHSCEGGKSGSWLNSLLATGSQGFVRLGGGRVTFSLRRQRESNQRERRPRRRAFWTSVSKKCVRWGRGFRQHIRVLTKTRGHPARAPAGLVVPTSPRLRGPKSGARRARQKQEQQQEHELLPPLFAWLLRAGARALDPGAPEARVRR